LILFLVFFRRYTNPDVVITHVVHIRRMTSVFYSFPFFVLFSIVKSQGKYLGSFNKVPHLSVQIKMKFQILNLLQYQSVFKKNKPIEKDQIPLCFPEVVTLPLVSQIVISNYFPLSPLGLIHIKNIIRQYRKIPTNQELLFKTFVSESRDVEKGIEVDFTTQILNESEIIWECVAVLLSRKKYKKKDNPPPLKEYQEKQMIKVEKDIGVKYAQVSGDYNPHHLYGWSAKILGYKKPIAHGMWTLQQAITTIYENEKMDFPYQVKADFKCPLYLPSDVMVEWNSKSVDGKIAFSVTSNANNEKLPHLIGEIEPIQ